MIVRTSRLLLTAVLAKIVCIHVTREEAALSTEGETAPPPGRLRRNALGAPSIVFLVMAAVAPLTATIVVVPLAIALGNGGGAPGAFVFVAVVLLLFAIGYMQMSRHVVNAGAFYAYVTRAMGRLPGLVTGFIALLGYNTFVVGAIATTGFFTNLVIDDLFGVDLPWQAWAAVGVAFVLTLGRRDVHLNARLLGGALVLETTIVLALDVSILVQDGFDLSALDPGTVNSGSLGLALLFAFTCFLGFEATAIFGEEARDPHRTVPRATWAAITVIGVFYALTALALVSAAGVSEAGAAAGEDPGVFVFAIAGEYLGSFVTDVLQLLLIVSMFAALLAFHNSASRYIFAIGRARVLPGALARSHERSRAPHVASVVQIGTAAAVVAVFAIAGADPILVIVPSMIGFGTLCIIALQFLASVSVVVFFRRRRDPRLGSTLVAPALGAIGLGYALFMAIDNFGTIAGSDSPVITKLPWLLLATILLGIAVGLWLRANRPAVYDDLGRDFLGEEAPPAIAPRDPGELVVS
jgi:amino acid transporter